MTNPIKLGVKLEDASQDLQVQVEAIMQDAVKANDDNSTAENMTRITEATHLKNCLTVFTNRVTELIEMFDESEADDDR